MALPTLAKTWEINANDAFNYQGSSLAAARLAVWKLFSALKLSGWSVQSSSDGTAASATDRWTDSSKINFNSSTSQRSWVVLRNSALGSTYDICIDCMGTGYGGSNLNTYPGNLSIFVRKLGFLTTSLSTSSRPGGASASDAEQQIVNFSGSASDLWFGGHYANDQALVFHWQKATDNTAFRFFVYNQDYLSAFIMIEKAGNPSAVWTSASSDSQVLGWGGSRFQSAVHVDIGGNLWNNGVLMTRLGATPQTVGLRTTVESYNGGWVTQGVINDQTLEYPMIPMGLVCTNAPYRMRLGNINDMWHTQISLPPGTTFPSDGTRQFLQLGGVIIPWGTSASPGPILRTRF